MEPEMPDDPVREAQFTAAMNGLRETISSLADRISRLETLYQADLREQLKKAREDGIIEGRLQEMKHRMDRMSTISGGIIIGTTVALIGSLFSIFWVHSAPK